MPFLILEMFYWVFIFLSSSLFPGLIHGALCCLGHRRLFTMCRMYAVIFVPRVRYNLSSDIVLTQLLILKKLSDQFNNFLYLKKNSNTWHSLVSYLRLQYFF